MCAHAQLCSQQSRPCGGLAGGLGKYLFERIHFPAIEMIHKLCGFKIQLFASFGHLCTLIPGALIINTGSAVPFLKNFFI